MEKKIISLILGITLIFTMSIPVFADDDVQTVNNSDGSQVTCEVSAVVDTSYTVNLPAKLSLKRKPNSDLYSGKLEYGCKGDLAYNQVIIINTDNALEMSKTVSTRDPEEKIHLRHVDVYEGDGTGNFYGSEPIIGSYITAEEVDYAATEGITEIFGSKAQTNGPSEKPLVSAAFYNNIPEVISFAGDHDLQDITDEYKIDQYNENMDSSSSEYCMEEKNIMLHIGSGYQRNEKWEGTLTFGFKTESIG
jgi:hypothetical protein